MFSPRDVETFRFVSVDFNNEIGEARFGYAFDDTHHFTETFTFPKSRLNPVDPEAFQRALFLLSLVAGISYYKAGVPKRAVIESGPVTQKELDALRTIYRAGLGEFAFVNKLELGESPEFEAQIIDSREITPVPLENGVLVAVGGGKDSCVTIETMRAGPAPVTLASLNQMRPIVDVMKASGLPSVHVDRRIDPYLIELNAEGAYNGHVPVTAVVSLTLAALAAMNGYEAVVMSNERSASVGNTEWDGQVVNHQWSKSLEAEELLAGLISQSVTPDLHYFSMLRPLSELEIARRFAKLVRYHDVFTSCNRAFRINEEHRVQRWCRDCPKCRFVFLALAPYVNPTRLAGIFGGNMLRDLHQADGFDALIGWNALKPFECVGEVEESVAAFKMLTDQIAWRDHEVVERFEQKILPDVALPDDLLTKPFGQSDEHHIPEQYIDLLHATE